LRTPLPPPDSESKISLVGSGEFTFLLGDKTFRAGDLLEGECLFGEDLVGEFRGAGLVGEPLNESFAGDNRRTFLDGDNRGEVLGDILGEVLGEDGDC